MAKYNRKKYDSLLRAGLLIIVFLVSLGGQPPVSFAAVKIWEEKLVLPTYLVGKPSIFPVFYSGRAYQVAKGVVYPYPFLDELTDQRVDKSYRAVFLENEYLKICVLPELGGKIFSAVDKSNNYEFFYHQHVIKPALIGLLGAWISGGVEWNFPHHHRATSFLPVDYYLEERPDGSKTIWVGEIELRHRMKWLVGITLYPHRAYLELTIRLENRTPFAHSFLYWTNVAVHTGPEYQVIFPPSTKIVTYHGKNQFAHWPVAHEVYKGVDYRRGVDISWWKNHPAPTSFFAWDCQEDFLAGYDHGQEAGVVQVANHHLVPGKKFWTWGTGEKGKMWEKILTDNDGPYLELMVGAFSDNQPDYSWLQPYEVRTFKQYWYPIKEIGGVKAANRKIALNLEIKDKKRLKIGLNSTCLYRQAQLIIHEGEKILSQQQVDISPPQPFLKEISLASEINEESLRVQLFSSSGKELITYCPPPKKKVSLPEPVKPPRPPAEIKTVEELYLTGLRLEQFHHPSLEPYPYYEEGLRRDPYDSRLNTALGLLLLKRGLYSEAETRLRRALERLTANYTSPRNGEPYYYLGVALRAQGRYEEAIQAFYRAIWSQAWAAASYLSLAEIRCLQGDWRSALELLNRSLALNRLSTRTLVLKAVVLRRVGRLRAAEEIIQAVLKTDPLDFWARNELFLLEKDRVGEKKALQNWTAVEARMGNIGQNYLELAVDYGRCGLWPEAMDCLWRLINSGQKKVTTYPLLYYYLGYFLEKTGEKKRAAYYFEQARQLSPYYCFPFRLETIDVLRTALEHQPNDPRAHYYLGNLLFHLQPEEALKEWEIAAQLDESFFLVHRNLGLGYAWVKNDIAKAISSLEKALFYEKSQPRLFYELDLVYEAGGVSPQKRLNLLQAYHNIVAQRDDSLSREILLLVQLGDYDQAIKLLESHHFHVWEGGGRIHDLFVDAYLLRGQKYFSRGDFEPALRDFQRALDYPENLEVGRPYHDRRAFQIYYFIGQAYEALGKNRLAQEFYQKAVQEKQSGSEIGYYQGLALKRLGRMAEANKMFDDLIASGRGLLEKAVGLDFFAKFGEKQSETKRRAQAHYLLGLGYLGKGKRNEAKAEFEKALQLNSNHFKAKHQLLIHYQED